MVRPRFICLLLALVTLLVYLPVWRHDFLVYDDPIYVTNNRIVQAGLSWRGVGWAFTSFHANNWHPLTWLSLMLDCQLFGPDGGALHLVNVLFHITNTLLLFLLLFRMTGALWPAAFVAALFAWHPLHVESVAWIAERKDVLSVFFGLLSLHVYVRYAQEKSSDQASNRTLATRRSTLDYALALLLFALSLMAKPMLVTLPFVFLLLDYWPLGRLSGAGDMPPSKPSHRASHHPGPEPGSPALSTLGHRPSTILRLALEKWPFFLLTAASCVVTYLAQRTEAVVPLDQAPLGLRLGNALVSYAGYLWKMIWPADLAVLYPLRDHIPGWQVPAAAGVLAVVSWCAWRARAAAPCLLTGWLWFLGTLVPVIGLVQVGSQAMADRYTYLPSIGVFIAIAYGVKALATRFRIRPLVLSVAATLVLAGCLVVTEWQLSYWRDSVSLFARALAVTQDNPIAQINLGVGLEQAGRRNEALAHYREALRLNPNHAQAQNNLGNLLDEMGRPDEALAHYREALRLKPDAPLAHDNLGTLLVELGRYEEALQQYAEAARLQPDDPLPHYLMGKARLRQGRSLQAVAQFRQALRLEPNQLLSLTWLARVLASDTNPLARDGAQAVALARQANELSGGGQPFVLDTLAMACAESGRFKDAQAAVQKAIDLATAAGAQDTVAAMQQRLRLYQAGQPYRESFSNAPPAQTR
jgi:protein O-mannosyl-transferase